MKGRTCYSYIRFSSEKQSHGDSLRRQLQLSENYAEKNGLVLDKTLNMRDLGLSGFHGQHVTKGALGEFLKLVNEGKIQKGSILLVESLDRLSRETMLTASTQFLSLLNSGITIVTLQDYQVYSPESINENSGMQLMVSIGIMSRAHDESLAKQKRISASWEEKRKNAASKKLTSKCPHWLILSREMNEYQVIPERVALIIRIFTMYLEGKGIETISRIFNREGIATWGRGKHWGKSYIWKLLRARTVLGEYQPKKFDENRKSTKIGDAIENYYPRIISEDLFYRVQSLLENNVGKFGKIGKCSNLFSHIAKCGYCGASMTYVNKGKPDYTYLVCENARRSGSCEYLSIKYQDIEESFLKFCKKLNIKDIINDDKDKTESQIVLLIDEINTIHHKISESKIKVNTWMELFLNTSKDVQVTVQKKLEEEHIIINDLNEKLKRKQSDLDWLQKRDVETESNLKEIQEQIENLKNIKDEKLFDIRKQLRTKIESLIRYFQIFPMGNCYKISKRMEIFSTSQNSEKQKLINDIWEKNRNLSSKNLRSYLIEFKDGGVLSIGYNEITGEFEIQVDIHDMKEVAYVIPSKPTIAFSQ